LELEGVMVTPANFYGIELNPRAAAIAEQVLWIGFLQWHLRTHGNLHNLPEPIIKDLHNIECRDAVLDYDSKTEQRDANGAVVTKWDGRTTKPHPVTGEEVPDPEAREPVYTYSNPKPAQWPAADYIVGNPPFIGTSRMREALGDGYTEALRGAYKNVPDSADFVMFWWDKAAELTRTGNVKRFGYITTNSLKQTFNRKVLQHHMAQKKPISLAFAIPDHPWVDSADGAAVRVAMTIGVPGFVSGVLQKVVKEVQSVSDDAADVVLQTHAGMIHADLSVGADVVATVELMANRDVAIKGFELGSQGFLVERTVGEAWINSDPSIDRVLFPYMNGKDLVNGTWERYVIDFNGLSLEEARSYGIAFQQIRDQVQPERQVNREERTASKWWCFRRSGEKIRTAILALPRFIATTRTAKHRVFQFLPEGLIAESKIVIIASSDAFDLAVLSSHIHIVWSLSSGAFLEDRPNYNHTEAFNKFPFPASTPAQQEKIRALGEQLDAHRKRQQALHPGLTMTGMYNVLERVRELETPGQARSDVPSLNAKEKVIYEQGLVGILKQLHDELDVSVAEAYGWSDLFSGRHSGPDPESRNQTDEILTRLVALNAERAAEEAQGHVRWLRPEYQNLGASTTAPSGKQAALDVDDAPGIPAATQRPWPKDLPAQAAALTEVLGTLVAPATVEEIAAHFEGKRSKKRVDEVRRLLETLGAVGRAVLGDGGWSGYDQRKKE
jgi:hypothetical protein